MSLAKLVIATHNPGKATRLVEYFKDLNLEILTLKDLGITKDVEETGKTFEENSRLKAEFFYNQTNLPTVADDGGLAIDVLNGEPGVKSRRWPGHKASDAELIEIMQEKLKDFPESQRTAKFIGVLTLALDKNTIIQTRGEVKGIMLKEPRIPPPEGLPWSGYFYIPELKKVHGEITKKEAENFSHRGISAKKLKQELKKYV